MDYQRAKEIANHQLEKLREEPPVFFKSMTFETPKLEEVGLNDISFGDVVEMNGLPYKVTGRHETVDAESNMLTTFTFAPYEPPLEWLAD